MIYTGKFIDINNKYIYNVKIGKSPGVTKYIIDNTGNTSAEEVVCFSGSEPVTMSSDTSDTFEHVYIRSCTINLISNYDVRKYVVAANYSDLPVEIRMAESGVNDTQPIENWTVIFSGYVLPMSFNQPFALKWNEFSLECTDKLGTLEYYKFHDAIHDYFYEYYESLHPSYTPSQIEELVENEYYPYRTPREFLNIALYAQFGNNIQYNIEYDCTNTTKINPSIFYGDSQDDWMTCQEAVEEIGKIYGVYVWQNSDYCRCENLLLMDMTYTTPIEKEDYMSDDANISVDEAYKKIKCEVDISNVDDDFIDPFNDDLMIPTENSQFPTRVMTEIYYKGDDKTNLQLFKNITTQASQQGARDYWYVDTDWSSLALNYVYKNTEIFDQYAQMLSSELLDFTKNYNGQTRSCYLDAGGANDSTKDTKYTLDWLKNNPGKGALINYCHTNDINDNKNTSAFTLPDLNPALVIQVGGHTENTDAERLRLQAQIENNKPICTFKLNNSTSFTPSDKSVTNYLVIDGKIRLNPVTKKTGPIWIDSAYACSRNTIFDCITSWANVGNWGMLWLYDNQYTLFKRSIALEDGSEDRYYYQNYTWENKSNPYYPDPNMPVKYSWPWNQKAKVDQSDMFILPYGKDRKLYKWQGSNYSKDEAWEIDDIYRIPILACELKIGDKYLCEDMSVANNLGKIQTTKEILMELYSWHTQAEASSLGLNTYFTLPVDPKIGDFILGQDLNIQNTCGAQLNISETGYAIPIPFDVALTGQVEFKILGPVNIGWDVVGYDKSGILWWREWWTTHNVLPLLSYVENIFVTDLEFKLVPDNGTYGKQLNDDNDLVYYSISNELYTDEESFDCKFCTSLTNDEVNQYGIDYKINNSSILDINEHAWYGMQGYGQESGYVKLEEARVAEQYNIWKKPRNIFEASLKCTNPEMTVDKTNYTISYLPNNIYRITSKEIDLKTNIMKVKMKDFS